MNLTNLLLIEAFISLIIVLILLLLKKRNDEPFSFREVNKNATSLEQEIKTPTLNQLLESEKKAKKEGSGIESKSLFGCWKFLSVWKQGIDKEDSISSSLLRLFSASLIISNTEINSNDSSFTVISSIEFGSLTLSFNGFGDLNGDQPLLIFFFENIELKLGSKNLFRRLIKTPDKRNKPFFALISMAKNGEWLAARGRGGGLALWLKD